MTKLFTLKNLACAGAMAFAMTLAAAPQAQAANATITQANTKINYETGTLEVAYTDGSGANDIKMPATADGTCIYFGNGKDATKAGKKLSLVADNDSTDSDKITVDVSGLLGKESVIVVAVDAEAEISHTINVVAAPTLKLKYGADGVEYIIDKAEEDIDSGYKIQYRLGAYSKWADVTVTSGETLSGNVQKIIDKSRELGTTLYLRVATVGTDSAQTSPWSKEAKLKVTAKAKAPKVSVKTALTKAFELKLSDKMEYTIASNGNSTEWTEGSGDKEAWSDIFSTAKATPGVAGNGVGEANYDFANFDVDNSIKGDAIAVPFTLQVRKPADNEKGKPASKITLLSFAKSPNSPTKGEIEVTAEKVDKEDSKDTVVTIEEGASIPDGYIGQYSVDGGKKWKNLTSKVIIATEKISGSKLQIRLCAEDKNSLLLPSAVTELTIPAQVTLNDAGAVLPVVITSTGWEVASSAITWTAKNFSNYGAGTVASTGTSA